MTSKMLLTTMINDHDDMMTVIMMMTMTLMMIAIPCLLGWSAWGSLLGLVRRKWVTCATHCISIHCISLQHFYALFFLLYLYAMHHPVFLRNVSCFISMHCNPLYFYALYFVVFQCTSTHCVRYIVFCCISIHCSPLHFHMIMCTNTQYFYIVHSIYIQHR